MTSKAFFICVLLLVGLVGVACHSSSKGGLATLENPQARGGHAEQVSPHTGLTTGVPQDPSASGYLNLHKRHPDSDEGVDEFNNAYSPAQGLQRLEQIKGFLDSFGALTRQARSRLSAAELKAAGNTQGDMQTIGFHNIPLFVEGTILKQDYQLRRAQYELARVKLELKQINPSELAKAKSAYEEATKRFQIFWDTKLMTD